MGTNKRKIICADRDYFPLLFAWKRKHPSENVKFIEPHELLAMAHHAFGDRVIPALMAKGMDYSSAKRWLRVLGVGDLAKADEVLSTPQLEYLKLPQELLIHDDLGRRELSLADVFLFEMPEDIELHRMLEREGIPYADLSVEELGISEVFAVENHQNVTLFQNKYEQFTYIFATLRKRLLDGEIKPSDVMIQLSEEGDLYFVELLGSIYGIKTRSIVRYPLFTSPKIASLAQGIYSRGVMSIPEEEEASEEKDLIVKLIDEFGLDKLPFRLAYPSLTEILKGRSVSRCSSDRGVVCSCQYAFQPDKEIYLTCMQYGAFHNVYSDDDVLSDEQLLRLSVNPSYVLTQLEKRKKKNFLRFHRFALVSRVKEHLDEKIYDSQFFEEYQWNNIPGPRYDEPMGVYTSEGERLFRMRELDSAFYTLPEGPYRSYDSRFKGIPGYEGKKKSWSVTELKAYYECPYAYYLGRTLPKKDFDPHAAYVGDMIHKTLEGVYGSDYDLEAAIAKGAATYRDRAQRDGFPLGPYDDVLMDLTASNLRQMVPMVRQQTKHAKILDSYSELRVQYTLSDEHGDYPFVGSIDSLLVLGDQTQSFFVIQDYKTGHEEFHPYGCFLGSSTQLPLYYYAIKGQGLPDGHMSAFGGLALKTVAFSDFATKFRDYDKHCISLKKGFEALAAKGIFLDDPYFWSVGDDTAFGKNDKLTFKGRFFGAGSYVVNAAGEGNASMYQDGLRYDMDQLIDEAVKATLEAIHRIERGEFPIEPSPTDPKEELDEAYFRCSYCPFTNVCYRVKARDARDTAKLVKLHFAKEGEGDAV